MIKRLKTFRLLLLNSTIGAWLGFFAFSVMIILRYFDDRQPDIYHYSKSAETLLRGENPYIQSDSRWGTVGQLIFAFPVRHLTTEQVSILLIALSIASLWLFLGQVLKIPVKVMPNCLIACLILSPVREIFALGQINLLCLGLVSFSVWLYTRMRYSIFFGRIKLIVSSIPAALAVDLKPHLFIFSTAVIILYKFTWKHLASILIALVAMHALVDLKFQVLFELYWLEALSNGSQKFLSSESKNLLGLFSTYFQFPKISLAAAVLLFALINLLILRIKPGIEFHNALTLVSLAGFLLPYFHYYDLLVPIVVFVSKLMTDKHERVGGISLFLLFINTVPYEFSRFSGAIFFMFGVIYFLFVQRQFTFRIKDAVFGLILYTAVQGTTAYTLMTGIVLEATINTIVVISMLCLIKFFPEPKVISTV